MVDNTEVLARVPVNEKVTGFYADLLKAWPKGAGEKPTPQMLMVPTLIDGKRVGVEALHLAMCLRPGGCTVHQYLLGSQASGPANNYRRHMVKTGWFSGTVEGKPYAYVLSFTAKGAAKLDKGIAAAEAAATEAEPVKPVKAKGKGTAKAKGKRKAKATVTVDPAPEPTSDQPTVTEGQPVIEAPAEQVTHTE